MDKETYSLEQCSWDLTDRCPLNCSHCCAKDQLSGEELTHEEALSLVEQLIDLKVSYVSLTGGEPLLREDWPEIAAALTAGGVTVSLITSAWPVNEETVRNMKASGLNMVGISVDGPKAIHDQIRCPGSYDRFQNAWQLMRQAGLSTSVISTVMANNIDYLPLLREELVRMGVEFWQLQLGLPMGNMKKNPENVIRPWQVKQIIDFCYDTARSCPIRVFPSDCIGYYTQKDAFVRKQAFQSTSLPVWKGCIGGKKLAHITSDGTILGASMAAYLEHDSLANLRARPLKEIWEDDRVFADFRYFDCKKLEGQCGTCQYRTLCQGGCTMVRLTLGGGVYAENEYCAYYQAQKSGQPITYRNIPLNGHPF